MGKCYGDMEKRQKQKKMHDYWAKYWYIQYIDDDNFTCKRRQNWQSLSVRLFSLHIFFEIRELWGHFEIYCNLMKLQPASFLCKH